MADNYQRGDVLPVQFRASVAGAYTTLNIKSQSGDLEVLTFDVTGTSHGGVACRIGGKLDGRMNITAAFDLDAPPYGTPPSLRPGMTGILLSYVSAVAIGRFFQLPMIVKKLHWESAVENELRWNCDLELNGLAGVVVYPAS